MNCLLSTSLSKASACCASKILTQFDKVRRMEYCLMNRTATAAPCYSVHLVTAERKGKLHYAETSTKGIRIKAINADYHSN